MSSVISTEYRGRLAIITIANEQKLNALNQEQYYSLAQALRDVATHDEVFITLLIGKGRFFSAGADVSMDMSFKTSSSASSATPHETMLRGFVANNLNAGHAFYTHPKILVVGLNGPVVGLSAALVAHADFVYAAPHAFLLTPFSSLGLVAEGLASRALVQRLGPSKANEALIMSKRISAEEMLATGFVNKIFDAGGSTGAGADERFRAMVLKEIDERLGEHLVGDSLLGIKALIRAPERDIMDKQGVSEVFAGLERFMTGVPQGEFMKIATGQKRHKL